MSERGWLDFPWSSRAHYFDTDFPTGKSLCNRWYLGSMDLSAKITKPLCKACQRSFAARAAAGEEKQ